MTNENVPDKKLISKIFLLKKSYFGLLQVKNIETVWEMQICFEIYKFRDICARYEYDVHKKNLLRCWLYCSRDI